MPDDKLKPLTPEEAQNAFNNFYNQQKQQDYVNTLTNSPYKNGISYDDYERETGRHGDIWASTSATERNVPYGEYNRLGIEDTRNPEYLQNYMSENQGSFEKLGNAGKRFLGNVLYETIGGIGSALDIEDYMNQNDEVGNWLTTWAQNQQEAVKQANPIYQRVNASAFGPGAFSWWLQNGTDLAASATSFIAQGWMGLKGIQAVNWLAKLGTGASLLGDAGLALKKGKDIATGLNRAETVGQTGQQIADLRRLKDLKDNFLTSSILNQSESIAGATQLYSQVYGDAIARGYGEDYAKNVAAAAAENSVNINRANIALNMTGVDMLMKRADNLGQALKPRSMMNTAKKALSEGIQEAGEESINLIAEKQSERYAKSILDQAVEPGDEVNTSGIRAMDFGNPFYDSTWSEVAENALLGALGGAAQTVGISGVKDNLGSSEGILSKIPLINRLNQQLGTKDALRYKENAYYPDGTLKYQKGDVEYETTDATYDQDEYYRPGTILTQQNISKEAINAGKKVGEEIKPDDKIIQNKKGESVMITDPEGQLKAEPLQKIKVDENGQKVVKYKQGKSGDRTFSLNELRDERTKEAQQLLDSFKPVIDKQAKMISSARYFNYLEKSMSGIEELINKGRHGFDNDKNTKQEIFNELAYVELANEGDTEITIGKVKARAKQLSDNFDNGKLDTKTLRAKQEELNKYSLARTALDAFDNNGKDSLIALFEDVIKMSPEKAKEAGYGENYKKNAKDSIDKINTYYDRWLEYNGKYDTEIAKALFNNRLAYDGLVDEADLVDTKMTESLNKEFNDYTKLSDTVKDKLDKDGKSPRDKFDEAFELEKNKNKKLASDKKLNDLRKANIAAREDLQDYLALSNESKGKDEAERVAKYKTLNDRIVKTQQEITKRIEEIVEPFNAEIKKLGLKNLLHFKDSSSQYDKKINLMNKAKSLDEKFDYLRSKAGRIELEVKREEARLQKQKDRVFNEYMQRLRTIQESGGAVTWQGNIAGTIEFEDGQWYFKLPSEHDSVKREDAQPKLVTAEVADKMLTLVMPGKEKAWDNKKKELQESNLKELEKQRAQLERINNQLGRTGIEAEMRDNLIAQLNKIINWNEQDELSELDTLILNGAPEADIRAYDQLKKMIDSLPEVDENASEEEQRVQRIKRTNAIKSAKERASYYLEKLGDKEGKPFRTIELRNKIDAVKNTVQLANKTIEILNNDKQMSQSEKDRKLSEQQQIKSDNQTLLDYLNNARTVETAQRAYLKDRQNLKASIGTTPSDEDIKGEQEYRKETERINELFNEVYRNRAGKVTEDDKVKALWKEKKEVESKIVKLQEDPRPTGSYALYKAYKAKGEADRGLVVLRLNNPDRHVWIEIENKNDKGEVDAKEPKKWIQIKSGRELVKYEIPAGNNISFEDPIKDPNVTKFAIQTTKPKGKLALKVVGTKDGKKQQVLFDVRHHFRTRVRINFSNIFDLRDVSKNDYEVSELVKEYQRIFNNKASRLNRHTKGKITQHATLIKEIEDQEEEAQELVKEMERIMILMAGLNGEFNLAEVLINPEMRDLPFVAKHKKYAEILGNAQDFYGKMMTEEGVAKKKEIDNLKKLITTNEKTILDTDKEINDTQDEVNKLVLEQSELKGNARGKVTRKINILLAKLKSLEKAKEETEESLEKAKNDIEQYTIIIDLLNNVGYERDANGNIKLDSNDKPIRNINFFNDTLNSFESTDKQLNDDLIRLQEIITTLGEQDIKLKDRIDYCERTITLLTSALKLRNDINYNRSRIVDLRIERIEAQNELENSQTEHNNLIKEAKSARDSFNKRVKTEDLTFNKLNTYNDIIALEKAVEDSERGLNERKAKLDLINIEIKTREEEIDNLLKSESKTDSRYEDLYFANQLVLVQNELSKLKQDQQILDKNLNDNRESKKNIESLIKEVDKIKNSSIYALTHLNQKIVSEFKIAETMSQDMYLELQRSSENLNARLERLNEVKLQLLDNLQSVETEFAVIKRFSEKFNKLGLNTSEFADLNDDTKRKTLNELLEGLGSLDPNNIEKERQLILAELSALESHKRQIEYIKGSIDEMKTDFVENLATWYPTEKAPIELSRDTDVRGDNYSQLAFHVLYSIPNGLDRAKSELEELNANINDAVKFKEILEKSIWMEMLDEADIKDFEKNIASAFRKTKARFLNVANQVESENNDITAILTRLDEISSEMKLNPSEGKLSDLQKEYLEQMDKMRKLNLWSIRLVAELRNTIDTFNTMRDHRDWMQNIEAGGHQRKKIGVKEVNAKFRVLARVDDGIRNNFKDIKNAIDEIEEALKAGNQVDALQNSIFSKSTYFDTLLDVAKNDPDSLIENLRELYSFITDDTTHPFEAIDPANYVEYEDGKPVKYTQSSAWKNLQRKRNAEFYTKELGKYYGEEYMIDLVRKFGLSNDVLTAEYDNFVKRVNDKIQNLKATKDELDKDLSLAKQLISEDELNNFASAMEGIDRSDEQVEQEMREISLENKKASDGLVKSPDRIAKYEVDPVEWQAGKDSAYTTMNKIVQFKDGKIVYDTLDGIPVLTANKDEIRFNNFLNRYFGNAEAWKNNASNYQLEMISLVKQRTRLDVKKLGDSPAYTDVSTSTKTKFEWEKENYGDKHYALGEGLVAVITDKDGNWIYVNDNGDKKSIKAEDLDKDENKGFYALVTNLASGASPKLWQENAILGWLENRGYLDDKYPLAAYPSKTVGKYKLKVPLKYMKDGKEATVNDLVADKAKIIEIVRSEMQKELQSYRLDILAQIDANTKVFKEILDMSAGDLARYKKNVKLKEDQTVESEHRVLKSQSAWLKHKNFKGIKISMSSKFYSETNRNRRLYTGVPYIELKDGTLIDTYSDKLDKNDANTVLTILATLNPEKGVWRKTDLFKHEGNEYNFITKEKGVNTYIKDDIDSVVGMLQKVMVWKGPKEKEVKSKDAFSSDNYEWQDYDIQIRGAVVQYKPHNWGDQKRRVEWCSMSAIRAYVNGFDGVDAELIEPYRKAVEKLLKHLQTCKKNVVKPLASRKTLDKYTHPKAILSNGKLTLRLESYNKTSDYPNAYHRYLAEKDVLKSDALTPNDLRKNGYTPKSTDGSFNEEYETPSIGRYLKYYSPEPVKPEPEVDDEETESNPSDSSNPPKSLPTSKFEFLEVGDEVTLSKPEAGTRYTPNLWTQIRIRKVADGVLAVRYDNINSSTKKYLVLTAYYDNGKLVYMDDLTSEFAPADEVTALNTSFKGTIPTDLIRLVNPESMRNLGDVRAVIAAINKFNVSNTPALETYNKSYYEQQTSFLSDYLNMLATGEVNKVNMLVRDESKYTIKLVKKSTSPIKDGNTLANYIESASPDVAKFIKAMSKNVAVEIVPEAMTFQANATLNPDGSSLVRLSPILFTRNSGEFAATIAHEYVHVLTTEKLFKDLGIENSEAFKDLENLRDSILIHMMRGNSLDAGTFGSGVSKLYYTLFANNAVDTPTNKITELIKVKYAIKSTDTISEIKDKLDKLKKEIGIKDTASRKNALSEFITNVINEKRVVELFDSIKLSDINKSLKASDGDVMTLTQVKQSLLASFIKMLNNLINQLWNKKIGSDTVLREIVVRGSNFIAESYKKEAAEDSDNIFGKVNNSSNTPKTPTESKFDKLLSDNALVIKDFFARVYDVPSLLPSSISDINHPLNAWLKTNEIFFKDVDNVDKLKKVLQDVFDKDPDDDDYEDSKLKVEGKVVNNSPISSNVSEKASVEIEKLSNEFNYANYSNVYATFVTYLPYNEFNELIDSIAQDEEFVARKANKHDIEVSEYVNLAFEDYMNGEEISPYLSKVFSRLKAVIDNRSNSMTHYSTNNFSTMSKESPVTVNEEYDINGVVLSQEELTVLNDYLTYGFFSKFNSNLDLLYEEEYEAKEMYASIYTDLIRDIDSFIEHYQGIGSEVDYTETKSLAHIAREQGLNKKKGVFNSMIKFREQLFPKDDAAKSNKNFDELYLRHARKLKGFGLSFEEVIDEQKAENEDESFKDTASRSSFQFDTKDNMPPAIKILISSLPVMTTAKRMTNAGVEEIRTIKRNDFGFPMLEDFEYAYNFLAKKLASIPGNMDLVLDELANLSTTNDRLAFLEKLNDKRHSPIRKATNDKGELRDKNITFNQFRLMVQFTQTFSKQAPKFYTARYNDDGSQTFFDANRRKNADQLLSKWEESLKQSMIPNQNGELAFDLDATRTALTSLMSTKDGLGVDLNVNSSEIVQRNIINRLKYFGIIFDNWNKASIAYAANNGSENLNELKSAIVNTDSIIHQFTLKVKALDESNAKLKPEDRINTFVWNPFEDAKISAKYKSLAEAEASASDQVVDLQHQSPTNKSIYGIGSNHALSEMITLYNYYSNKPNGEALMRREAPWLFNVSSKGSRGLKLLTSGKGVSIQLAVLGGVVAHNSNEGEDTESMKLTDRWSLMITGTLDGFYTYYRAGDRGIENMFAFIKPNGTPIKLYENRTDALNAQFDYLIDELRAIFMFKKRDLGKDEQFYSKYGDKLRFFSGRKLSDDTKKRLLDLVDNNDDFSNVEREANAIKNQLQEEIKSYFRNEAKLTRIELKKVGCLRQHNSSILKEEVYDEKLRKYVRQNKANTEGVKYIGINSRLLKNYLPNDLSKDPKESDKQYSEALDELIFDFVLYQNGGYIEQNKLLVGDPAMFKNTDDFFKRMAMFNSTKKISVVSDKIDAIMNSRNTLVAKRSDDKIVFTFTQEESKALILNKMNLSKSLSKDRFQDYMSITNSNDYYDDDDDDDVKIVPDMFFNKGRLLSNRAFDGQMRSLIFKDVSQVSALAKDDVVKTVIQDGKPIYYDANDAIISDDKVSVLRKTFTEAFIKDGVPSTTIQDKVDDYLDSSYRDMKISDAQAYVTIGMYKEILLRAGDWTKAHDVAYNKIIMGESLSTSELMRFRILKTQYTGMMAPQDSFKGEYEGSIEKDQEDMNLMIPTGYKHSIFPLLPQFIKGSNLEKLNEMMENEGVDIAHMMSANKFGTKTLNGKTNVFYDKNGKFTYTSGRLNGNPIVTQNNSFIFFGIQLDMAPKLKGKVTASSQFRKLILSNLLEQGVPYDYIYSKSISLKSTVQFENASDKELAKEAIKRWSKLTESEKRSGSKVYELTRNYIDVQKALYQKPFDKLLNEIEFGEDEDGNYVIGNRDALVQLAAEMAKDRNASDNVIESIMMLASDNTYIETVANKDKVENTLFAILNSRVIREKRKGEGSPQVSVQGFEIVDKNGNTVDKDGNIITHDKYSSNPTLRSYVQGKDGKTLPSQIIISLPENLTEWVNAKYGSLSGLNEQLDILHDLLDKKELNGEDISLTKDQQRLLKLITVVGFRIPNQGLNSSDYMRVRRFMPYEFADACVVPAEMVAKAGSDFDIDKLNIFFPHYTPPKVIMGAIKREPEYVEFSTDPNEAKERWYSYVKDMATSTRKSEAREGAKNSTVKERELLKASKELIASSKSNLKDIYAEQIAERKELDDLYMHGHKLFKDLSSKWIREHYYQLVDTSNKSDVISMIVEFKALTNELLSDLRQYVDQGITTYVIPKEFAEDGSYEEEFNVPTIITQLEELDAYYDEYILKYSNPDTTPQEYAQFKDEIKAKINEANLNKKEIASLIREISNEYIINSLVENSKGNILGFDAFIMQPIEMQNSREANENRILDISKDVLALSYNYRQIVAPVSDAVLNSQKTGAVWEKRLLTTEYAEFRSEVLKLREAVLNELFKDPNNVKGYFDANGNLIKSTISQVKPGLFRFDTGIEISYLAETENFVSLTDEGLLKYTLAFAPGLAKIQERHSALLQSETSNSSIELIATPRVNMEKFKYFLSGLAGVGQTAVHITNHQLAMMVNLHLKHDDNYFIFKSAETTLIDNNGDEVIKKSLAAKMDPNGEWISETLSAFINAYVDVVKDPYIYFLNGGNATANTIFYLVRTGASIKWITKFLTQPIIVDFVSAQEANESIVAKAYNSERKTSMIVSEIAARYLVDDNTILSEEYINSESDKIHDEITGQSAKPAWIFYRNNRADDEYDRLFNEMKLAKPNEKAKYYEDRDALRTKTWNDNQSRWNSYLKLQESGLFEEDRLAEYITFGTGLYESILNNTLEVGKETTTANTMLNTYQVEMSQRSSFWANNVSLYGKVQVALLDLFLEYRRQSKLFQAMIRSTSADTKAAKKNLNDNKYSDEEIERVRFMDKFGNFEDMIDKTIVEVPTKAIKQYVASVSPMYFSEANKIVKDIKDRDMVLFSESTARTKDKLERVHTNYINALIAGIATADFGDNKFNLGSVFEELFITSDRNKYFNAKGEKCSLPELIRDMLDKNVKYSGTNKIDPKSSLNNDKMKKIRNNLFIKQLVAITPKASYKSYDEVRKKNEIISTEPKFGVIEIHSRKMQTKRENELRQALLQIKELDYDFYIDLIRFTLNQSGIGNSPITWTKLIPARDLSAIFQNAIDKFNALSNENQIHIMKQISDQFKRLARQALPITNIARNNYELNKDEKNEDKEIITKGYFTYSDRPEAQFEFATRYTRDKDGKLIVKAVGKELRESKRNPGRYYYNYQTWWEGVRYFIDQDPSKGIVGHNHYLLGIDARLSDADIKTTNNAVNMNFSDRNKDEIYNDFAKDEAKYNMTNSFIGYGAEDTSTSLYAKQLFEANYPVNKNIVVTPDTRTWVSVNGGNKLTEANKTLTLNQIRRVLDGGGMIVMANDTDANSSYNASGEGVIQKILGKPTGQLGEGKFNYWQGIKFDSPATVVDQDTLSKAGHNLATQKLNDAAKDKCNK